MDCGLDRLGMTCQMIDDSRLAFSAETHELATCRHFLSECNLSD